MFIITKKRQPIWVIALSLYCLPSLKTRQTVLKNNVLMWLVNQG
ncbi:hypothetical protein HMPREF3218_0202078 [Prevotella bivia]|nr:hypothetical protein HMPREF3218_0202078 [Prevotella bivia]